MACPNCKRMNKEIKLRIDELVNSGYNVNQIASMVWINKEQVEQYLNAPKKDTKPTVEPVVEPDANV